MFAALALVVAGAPSWSLAVGGDMMLNGIRAGSGPLAAIAPVFLRSDLGYANLEVPLTTARTPTSRKSAEELKARTQFVLRADPAHTAHVAESGVDLVSVASNHTMDFGGTGVNEMLAALETLGLKASGAGRDLAAAEEVAVVDAPGGVRVGLVSYLAFVGDGALAKCGPAGARSPGVATLAFQGTLGPKQLVRVQRIVAGAKRRCDLLLVALHWGMEREPLPRPYQVSLGRAFVDAGADVVLGTHPHVLQGAELYRGKPILYSLGNLVSALPGDTAVFRLRFGGTKLTQVQVFPVRISGGRAVPLQPRRAIPARAAFVELCAKVVKTYPNRRSRPLILPKPKEIARPARYL